jgi:YgiT-type zinc finger domain-containing protein
MVCNACEQNTAKIEAKPVAYDNHGTAVMIRRVPTIICDECGTRVYADETVGVLERILKEVEAPYVDSVAVDYERAVEEWSLS